MKRKMKAAALLMAGILTVTGLTACGGGDDAKAEGKKGTGDGIELTVSH